MWPWERVPYLQTAVGCSHWNGTGVSAQVQKCSDDEIILCLNFCHSMVRTNDHSWPKMLNLFAYRVLRNRPDAMHLCVPIDPTHQ